MIQGDFTQTATGVLSLELAGPSAGSGYDQLSVSGTVLLDGSWEFNSSTGSHRLGSEFMVIPFANHGGIFSTIDGLAFGGGKALLPKYESTGFTLLVVDDSANKVQLGDVVIGAIEVAGARMHGISTAMVNRRYFLTFSS